MNSLQCCKRLAMSAGLEHKDPGMHYEQPPGQHSHGGVGIYSEVLAYIQMNRPTLNSGKRHQRIKSVCVSWTVKCSQFDGNLLRNCTRTEKKARGSPTIVLAMLHGQKLSCCPHTRRGGLHANFRTHTLHIFIARRFRRALHGRFLVKDYGRFACSDTLHPASQLGTSHREYQPIFIVKYVVN